MKLTVKTHPTSNLVITQNTNKPEWGTVRVEQVAAVVNNGILSTQKKVAFFSGKMADLQALDLKANGEFPVPGKLVTKESTTPFYEGQQPKIATGTTVVCSVEGQPIYRDTQFTSDLTANDVLIAHDNQEAIKAAQANVAQVRTMETA